MISLCRRSMGAMRLLGLCALAATTATATGCMHQQRGPQVVDYGQVTVDPAVAVSGEFVAGPTCVGPYGDIAGATLTESIDNFAFAPVWRQEMEDAGYAVTAGGSQASNYYVEGRVAQVEAEICRENDFGARDSNAFTGTALIAVDWTVHVSATNETVFSARTIGEGTAEDSARGGLATLVRAGLRTATAGLAREPGYRALLLGETMSDAGS